MVSRMVGSPPGYVGHEEGGQLTEKVRRKPYSVVLFDEIEKAHPEVVHILLQVLEEGMLTDSQGRKVNFRNTIIIMTSNLGSKFVKGTGLGFTTSDEADFSQLKKNMTEEAKKVFRPELMNRVDDLIVFRQLSKKSVSKILDLELAKVTSRIISKNIQLSLSSKAKEFLIQHGYDVVYGARPLRRSIEKYLQDPLAEAILAGELTEPEKINVVVKKNKLHFRQASKSAASK
jgi:ATP-dependent Clp protease ATP-binding subunit ClpC